MFMSTRGRRIDDDDDIGIDDATHANGGDVTDLVREVKVFHMASCLYWGVWGVLRAAEEVIGGTFRVEGALSRLRGDVDRGVFDYLRYGRNRLARFRCCKSTAMMSSHASDSSYKV
jgi:hypothetical protein